MSRRTYSALPLFLLGVAIPALSVGYHFVSLGQVQAPPSAVPMLGTLLVSAGEILSGRGTPPASATTSVQAVTGSGVPRSGDVPAEVSATAPPSEVRLQVLDADTGRPIAARVLAGSAAIQARGELEYTLPTLPTQTTISVTAPGYEPKRLLYSGQDSLSVKLAPIYRGVVRDGQSGKPVPGARVVVDGRILHTDEEGRYELPARPSSGRFFVLKPGYLKAEVDLQAGRDLDLELRPHVARGLYLTMLGAAHKGLRENAIGLLERSEVNTLVLDVKGDRGWILYPSAVPLAQKIGANEVNPMPAAEGWLADLKKKGIYTIARIVVFKDDLLARHGPSAGVDVAIRNSRTGGVWIDGEDLGWVDPFQEAAWDYNIALAREAARKGFDEIQFDYIRFPTDPSAGNAVDNAVYSRPATEENRVAALERFLERARAEVAKEGAYLSIDTFGYTCWADDDMGIGQNLARLGKHVDYISPMIYPSTYSAGLPGMLNYPAVVSEPYEVISESLKQAEGRVRGTGAVVRPWLQYFDDYPWATGLAYNAPQIQAQKRAVANSKATGWLFWDPANKYDRGGFETR